MDLSNEVEIDAPIQTVWEAVNDVERIAPCLPGAQLQEIDDEAGEYRGVVKVKVGPVTAQYKGAASFNEQDAASRQVRLAAKGRDSRGAGTANAVITATLTESAGGRTRVTVGTDLTVTGKVAQFGRGVLADVSEKLMGQFAGNLETMLEQDAASAADPEPAPEAEPVDLMEIAGGSLAKRLVPIAGVVVALLVVWWLLRRRADESESRR